MSTHTGKFVWYELLTSDAPAAQAFYTAVIGWQAQAAGMSSVPDSPYVVLSAGATMVGGLMALPPEALAQGARPAWHGYVAVDDVDAMAARFVQAGGKVLRAPDDIPQVGRFAVVADPQCAPLVLFKSSMAEVPAALPGGTPGTIGWHELHANDQASAMAFYAEHFGWTRSDTLDMGPNGLYQLFATGDGTAVGGMLTRLPQMPMPFWLYYINVADIHAALARVGAHGGQLLMGPHQVPGGSWIAHCLDPQGALFALVGPDQAAG